MYPRGTCFSISGLPLLPYPHAPVLSQYFSTLSFLLFLFSISEPPLLPLSQLPCPFPYPLSFLPFSSYLIASRPQPLSPPIKEPERLIFGVPPVKVTRGFSNKRSTSREIMDSVMEHRRRAYVILTSYESNFAYHGASVLSVITRAQFYQLSLELARRRED